MTQHHLLDKLRYAERLERGIDDIPGYVEHSVRHIDFGFELRDRRFLNDPILRSFSLREYRKLAFQELTYTILKYLYGDLINDYLKSVHVWIRRTSNPNNPLWDVDIEFLDKWYISSRDMPDVFEFKILDNRSPEEYDVL